jgi:hypothetical protein
MSIKYELIIFDSDYESLSTHVEISRYDATLALVWVM